MTPDAIAKFVNLPLVKPAISKSALSSFYTCQRMFMYEYMLRLTSNRYMKAPTVGTLFHAAINWYYDGLDTPAVHRKLDSHVDDMTHELLEGPETAMESEIASDIVRNLAKDNALVKVMAEIYNEKFPLDTDLWSVYPAELKLEYSVPANLAWAKGKDTFRVTSRIDRLLHNRELDGLFVVDFKTTGDSPALFQRTLDWSVEADLSRVIVEAGLKAPVLGFLLGVIRKPSIKIKSKTNKRYNKVYRPDNLTDFGLQSQTEYLAEVRDWYAGTGFHADKADQRLLDPPLCQWVRRFRGPAMNERIHHHLVQASRAADREPTLFNFPRTGEPAGHCRNMYHRVCPWLKLCEADRTDWQGIIDKNYKVRPASEPDTLEEI